jgi:precorrin-4 methylase
VTAVDASEFTAAAFALQSHFTGPNQMRSYIQTRSEGEEKPKEGKAKPVYWEQPIIQTYVFLIDGRVAEMRDGMLLTECP